MDKVDCVAPTGCSLGEGPVWSPSDGFLWWVDIPRAKLHRFNPKTGNTRRYDLPIHASALALYQGQLLMIGDREAGLYDPATEGYERKFEFSEEPAHNRTNDAGIAPDGTLWLGTMDDQEQDATGNYYALGTDWRAASLPLSNAVVTNTFCFSPDGHTFYTCDSAEQEILSYDYDPLTGALSDRRVFATTAAIGAYPDGSAIDAEGCLWNAQWAGSRIVRYTPEGAIDRIIGLPVSRPTSVAFGGKDLKTLFITTARIGLGDKALDRQPMAGCLFALDVDVPGLPVREWGQV
ncbi:MAG: SMP-30/gluconolactonase/LRE family protein [Pseudomonadota bacterium]